MALFPGAAEGRLARWSKTFCFCLGTKWCQRLRGNADWLEVRAQGRVAAVGARAAQGSEDAFMLDLDALGSADLDRKAGARHKIALKLPDSEVLVTRTTLPAAVRVNLRNSVMAELDRLTPFAPEQVYFDYREIEPRSAQERLTLEVCLVRRETADTWLDWLKRAGHPASELSAESAWPKQNLLVADGARKQSLGSWLSAFMVFLAVCLVLVALAIPLYQKRQIVLSLSERMKEAQVQTNSVFALRKDLEEARTSARAVLQQRLDNAPVSRILLELTRLLPDDTWVQSMDIKEARVQLRGETLQASALLGVLENSNFFKDVVFSSPVVQVRNSQKQRFHISAKLIKADD